MKPIAISTILYFAILTGRSIFQTRQRKVSKDASIPNETMAMSSKVSIETLQTGHGGDVASATPISCPTRSPPQTGTSSFPAWPGMPKSLLKTKRHC